MISGRGSTGACVLRHINDCIYTNQSHQAGLQINAHVDLPVWRCAENDGVSGCQTKTKTEGAIWQNEAMLKYSTWRGVWETRTQNNPHPPEVVLEGRKTRPCFACG